MKRSTQPSLFDLPDAFAGPEDVATEQGLVALAVSLGAARSGVLAGAERRLLQDLPDVPSSLTADVRAAIASGDDPLGEIFCRLRSPEERRPQGATYTPRPLVDWMLASAAKAMGTPARVVDPGMGSGRFLVAAGKRFPEASLVGVETDPVAALLARANLATCGMTDRATILLADYRLADVGSTSGRTLYVGNPPYVRHHQIEPEWKQWLTANARRLGLAASQLAGLHVHFFLSTALRSKVNDVGVFVTAAEWLDVNYGRLIRDLFLGPMGGKRIDVIEPTAKPFPDAATTAAIALFEVGCRPPSVVLRRVSTLDGLDDETMCRTVNRDRLQAEARWSHLTRSSRKGPKGHVELGELFRVHRGQVTGANKVWIAGEHSVGMPESVLFPTVTRAKELFRAGTVLRDDTALRLVIDLPAELEVFKGEERKAVDRFLAAARRKGVDKGYIASNRRAWWSVGLREPAPILATYMARRPPAFVRNEAGARHINIAHGLYPREIFEPAVLTRLVNYLTSAVTVAEGRTYAGGLTKFEPREMERLLVPSPQLLRQEVLE